MNTTKIIQEISFGEYKELILKYKEKIQVSSHAFDHLSECQRKLFKEERLINTVKRETPRGIGLQRNGRHAVFSGAKTGFRK